MTYKLYGMSGACSMAVHVILNELDQRTDYIEVRQPAGQPKSSELLKVNPRGNVPVLDDNGTIIREGGAIISYLLDKHHSPMLPKSGPERAAALEWLMFANATMHPAYSKMFGLMGGTFDAKVKDELVKQALDRINLLWKDVDTQLAKGTYLCGDQITGADFLLTVIANWAQDSMGKKIVLGANTKKLITRIIARPSYKKALAEEKVEYKAAA